MCRTTSASSDKEERRETRNSRFRIPASEDVEQALISSAADEHKVNQKFEVKLTECEQGDVEEYDTDDDLRRIMWNMVPQGIEAFEDVSPP